MVGVEDKEVNKLIPFLSWSLYCRKGKLQQKISKYIIFSCTISEENRIMGQKDIRGQTLYRAGRKCISER